MWQNKTTITGTVPLIYSDKTGSLLSVNLYYMHRQIQKRNAFRHWNRKIFWNFMCNWKWYKLCFNLFSPENCRGELADGIQIKLYEIFKLNNVCMLHMDEWADILIFWDPSHNLMNQKLFRCSKKSNVCSLLPK